MSKEGKAIHDHYPHAFTVESLDTQRMNVATNTSLKLNVDFVESAMKKSNATTKRIKPTTPKSKKRSFYKKLLYSPLSFYKKCCKSPSEADDALKVNAKAAIGQSAWTQREWVGRVMKM